MPDSQQIYDWIKQLASENEAERQSAEDSITALGADAVPYLRSARGRVGFPTTEALRLLGIVGDTCSGRPKKVIIETMEYVMKSPSKLIPPQEKVIAQAALERWGQAVPQPKPPVILKCYKCNRPSTLVHIRKCFLPGCDKPVCEDHAAIITGGMGTWFCSEEHKKRAMQDISLLM